MLWDGLGEKYCSNVLAGGVAVILSVLVSAAYVVLTETAYNNKDDGILNCLDAAVLAVCNGRIRQSDPGNFTDQRQGGHRWYRSGAQG